MVIAGMDPSDFADLGQVWQSWGGVWGGALNDPIHFEYPGFSSGRTAHQRTRPVEGGAFYKLADFISGFVPYLAGAQLVDDLVTMFDGNEDIASFYLHHPAEALRDLVKHWL
jgi:hypothetical protein